MSTNSQIPAKGIDIKDWQQRMFEDPYYRGPVLEHDKPKYMQAEINDLRDEVKRLREELVEPAGQQQTTRLDVLSLIREHTHRCYVHGVDMLPVDQKYMREIEGALRSLDHRAKLADQCRADADRYRWLRDTEDRIIVESAIYYEHGPKLDAAIDAAIAAHSKAGEPT